LDPFVEFEFNLVVGFLILDWFCGEFGLGDKLGIGTYPFIAFGIDF